MNLYVWKLKSLAKGIDPQLAVDELQRIEKIFGKLNQENILKASEPEDSVLHSLFLWDDTEAAHRYRLRQAMDILNNVQVTVISDGEERQISVYEIISSDQDRSYKHVLSMSIDDLKQIRARTVRELNSLRSKLSFYSEFQKALEIIQKLISEIESPE